jgi:hypothetical protein
VQRVRGAVTAVQHPPHDKRLHPGPGSLSGQLLSLGVGEGGWVGGGTCDELDIAIS